MAILEFQRLYATCHMYTSIRILNHYEICNGRGVIKDQQDDGACGGPTMNEIADLFSLLVFNLLKISIVVQHNNS